jgi:hypothetical protein
MALLPLHHDITRTPDQNTHLPAFGWNIALQENIICSSCFLNSSAPRNITVIYSSVPEPRNISSPNEHSLIHSSVNQRISVVVYSSINQRMYRGNRRFKKIIPVHYFSLPACRTVHIFFDSIFCSALLPPLLPTSSLTPALAHTLCVHPHHQPALSSADRHRPSHRLTPRRHHHPHFWLPLAHPHGLHPHWRPCPARPRHLPPRKPPPPTRF